MGNQDRRLAATGRLGYVPALDGVRGIAALGVLLIHYVYPVAVNKSPLTFVGGEYGVSVFFALSGFLITTLLLEEYHRRGSIDLRAFWARRALRLMPALLLVIASLVILGGLVDAGIPLAGQGLHEIPSGPEGAPYVYIPFWPGIIVSLLPVSNWVWAQGFLFNPLGIGWTLAIEDQYYLVWPFILMLLVSRSGFKPRSSAVLVIAIAVAAVLWRSALWMTAGWSFNRRTDFYIAELLIGCACGLVVAAGMVPTSLRGRRLLGALAWASLVGIIAMFVQGEPRELNRVLALIGVLTAVLVTHIVIDRGSRLSGLLSWPPLVGIGQVSYGLYLWHWVWLKYPILTESIRVPVAVALTSATVLASYYLVERPALRLKHRFAPTGESRSSGDGGNREGGATASRRNLLPVLGMTSVTVAAACVYFMSDRFYPRPVIASASTPTPVSTPIPVSTPTPMPRPTRLPRASRKATARAGGATTKTMATDHGSRTRRRDRIRSRATPQVPMR